MPARFGGVGAWLARRNSAVFLRSRDRGCEDAVFYGNRRRLVKCFSRVGACTSAVPAAIFFRRQKNIATWDFLHRLQNIKA